MAEKINNNKKSISRWVIGTAVFMAVFLCFLACGLVYLLLFDPPNFINFILPAASTPISIPELITESSATPFQPLPTATATPTPIPTPTSIPLPTSIPDRFQINGVYGHAQIYSLDCESRSAVDWASFFGTPINELDFLSRLPQSDDPDSGFVGNINGYLGQLPPKSYGVHAKPVAALLTAYGVQAQSVKGFTWDDLKAEIRAGRPVIVWIVNYPYGIDSRSYTATNGHTTTVARFEHTWIISGYDPWAVMVVDSQWTYRMNISEFLSRWAALGNMAIIHR